MAGESQGATRNSASSPNPTSATISANPPQTPARCGSVRRTPKFTPDAISIMLLGPGVAPATMQNRISASRTSRRRFIRYLAGRRDILVPALYIVAELLIQPSSLAAMPSDSEIKSALAGVIGPDGRTPLPDSGAIEGITQRDGKVFIAIRVDPAQAATLGP